jgi:predicted metalloendopeptidase
MNQFDNFYNLVNSEWFKKDIPPDYSRYGTFDEIQDTINKKLLNILSNLDNENETYNINLLKNTYKEGINYNKREELKYRPLNRIFKLINNIKSISDVYKILGKLNILGFDIFFHLYISEDIKNNKIYRIHLNQKLEGLPSKEYFFEKQYKDIIPLYKNFLKEILNELGLDNLDNKIFEFEKEIANITLNNDEKRDIEKNYINITLKELKKKIPEIDNFINNINIIKRDIKKYYDNIILDNLEYFINFNEILKRYDIEFIKNYLKLKILILSSNYLNDKISLLIFNFYGYHISGKQKRKDKEKIILNQLSDMFGEILGELFINKYYNQETDKKVKELCKYIFKAAKTKILSCKWLENKTKNNAIDKLNNIKCKIGYPTKIKNYNNINIHNLNYYDIFLLMNLFYTYHNINKLGRNIEKDEWLMDSFQVNAYYNPVINEIVLPAGICQYPFFDIKQDFAINLGGLGTTIAHEISHAFDDQGRKFDLEGNLTNWWTENDEKRYNKETNKLIKQFNNLKLLDRPISGYLTLGENIADYSGVSIAIEALKLKLYKKQEISQDLNNFFISYAQSWKEKIKKKELLKRLTTDEHAPAIFRTNQILSNIPEFYKLYNIRKGHLMYLSKKKRINLW